MKSDPCFRCPLRDCDDRSPRCVLRRLARSCEHKRRKGTHDRITDEEREAYNRIFHIWYLDRCALAAEGARPYARWKGGTDPRGDSRIERLA